MIVDARPDKRNKFGWVKVKGSIDGIPLKQYKLMPMGDGRLFLPVKKDIRKKIGKEAGDKIRVVLTEDHSELEIPAEILDCFSQERPERMMTFNGFSESERKAYIDWIYEAKNLDTRARRILRMMERLGRKLRLHDTENTWK